MEWDIETAEAAEGAFMELRESHSCLAGDSGYYLRLEEMNAVFHCFRLLGAPRCTRQGRRQEAPILTLPVVSAGILRPYEYSRRLPAAIPQDEVEGAGHLMLPALRTAGATGQG